MHLIYHFAKCYLMNLTIKDFLNFIPVLPFRHNSLHFLVLAKLDSQSGDSQSG